jgi:hypothetical protein
VYHNTFCLSRKKFGVLWFFTAIGRKNRPERGLAGEEFLHLFGTVVSHLNRRWALGFRLWHKKEKGKRILDFRFWIKEGGKQGERMFGNVRFNVITC